MIEPFDGYLLSSAHPEEIVAPEPSTLDEATWHALRARNPNNVAVLMPDTHTWLENAVALARSRLDQILQAEYKRRNGYLAYRVAVSDHAQIGVVGMSDIDHYNGGRILPHEAVRPGVVPAVAATYRAVRVSTNPVTLMFRGEATWLEDVTSEREPLLDFVTDSGQRETVWQLEPDEAGIIENLQRLYIADGHHRIGAAQALALDGFASRFAFTLFPADQMRILGYHRMVHHVPEAPRLLAELSDRLQGAPTTEPPEPAPGEVAIFDGTSWSRVRLLTAGTGKLDPEALRDEILGPILGIIAGIGDPRLEYIPGWVSPAELQRMCEPGSIALALAPVPPSAVMDVADSGRLVPPKSTWFSPKTRAGLFLQVFD